jgi:4-hydroxybenzoate polyprenyltransferase
MIREYLKLARSFNAVLTGISPVMGAIAMQQYNIPTLIILFFIGFLGHSFGFVFNDILDYNIDKSSKEISDRPLISGTISIRNAWIFAFSCMIVAFILSAYLAVTTQRFFPILILAVSAFFIALYDIISKKFPLTDFFVAFGVFFLILYGASTVTGTITQLTSLTWFVCVLGAIQVLYMQIVAGGMKDIENDYYRGAKTLAIKMGIRIIDGKLKVSARYKALAYSIQLIDLIIVFMPFFIIWNIRNLSAYQYIQWAALLLIGVLMLFLSHRLLSMENFDRMKARKLIGSHYMINFTLVPIMLMSLNPWAGILMFLPGLGFVISNLLLHGTLLAPKTM